MLIAFSLVTAMGCAVDTTDNDPPADDDFVIQLPQLDRGEQLEWQDLGVPQPEPQTCETNADCQAGIVDSTWVCDETHTCVKLPI